jgi:hypothetical protein
VERRKQARGRHQHFIGSWARLDGEYMPVIPAWIVRTNLYDPRDIPYLLVWKDDRHDGKIMEAVRPAHFVFFVDVFWQRDTEALKGALLR